MAVYTITTESVEHSYDGGRWHLDFPAKDMSVDLTELRRDGLLLQGWLLSEAHVDLTLVILNGKNISSLPLTQERPDVIRKVLGEEPASHPQLLCGFSKRVKLSRAAFSVGVIANGKFTELLKGSVEGKFQVLKGAENWLFLDNDSNKSVDQFTGKRRLSRTARSEWKSYFSSVVQYSSQTSLPVCMLVAPSKEMVFSEYYPHKESLKAPIYDLVRLVPASLDFVFPVKELQSLPQRSFRVCDTHWTLHGARCASQLVASKLSGKQVAHFEVFEKDRYQQKRLSGDLGSKLFPPQRHVEDSLCNFNYRKTVVYDNNIDNFGRIIVMVNTEAVLDETLLLFGSSSSYTMFHYICRLYSTVVFVHTAGNIDNSIIEQVKPDCMCLQTNARFVVKSPKFNDSVLVYIAKKRASGQGNKAVELADSLPFRCKQYIHYFNSL
ncbi:hypothetical protein [Salinimonas chungwhensis]|uniref:hypothetical protein n=1 Tax=Salinimonas chungwhensis TaxID=265425 RepID=UPI000367790A|nr:hypothetical protein [Salinimonas chungwhensis]